MEINKKNRTELKSYFLANKIPTQKNFEEFIDANLNQAEDGITKTQGNPIALQTEGDASGTQETLHIYKSFPDTNPSWALNLNPRVDPTVPTSNKPGLNIKDGGGTSRLFIKSTGGNVGIGTIEPSSKLSIKATKDESLISVTGTNEGNPKIFEVKQEANDGTLYVRQGSGENVSKLSGNPNISSFFLSKVGIGIKRPEANLHIKGDRAELRIKNTLASDWAFLSIKGPGTKSWDIAQQGNNDTLEFRPNGGDTNRLIMRHDGSIQAPGGVMVSGNRTSHLDVDGSFYRYAGQVYVTVDDNFYIRDTSGAIKLQLETNSGRIHVGGPSAEAPISISGDGKETGPNTSMHITQNCILFGGNNNGKEVNSAQISAGKHVANSLNIVGMSSGTGSGDRRVNVWAEGGMAVQGKFAVGTIHAPEAPISISGGGKETGPNTSMHITQNCILFGGNNNGKETNSAQISAGKHVANSLNIIGMSSGTGSGDRKVNVWAEGGMAVQGKFAVGTTGVAEAPISISGDGKENGPNGSMHITNDCILFGGKNNGKQADSAQISAGRHAANSLNIVGMSSGTSHADRRIDVWAEGGMKVNGNLTATAFFGDGSSKIEWTLGFNDKAASTGTWNPTGGWGEPKFHAKSAYSTTSGPATTANETLDFNIPSGAKTVYISTLSWSSTGYFDIYLKMGGVWKFHRRINDFQSITTANSGGSHDGNRITMAATGLDHFTQIRIQCRKGRVHFTGLGFSREDMAGSYEVGTMHQDNIVLPHIVRGMIIMWTGAAAPAGWALCNGGNGTPDLRGRFVLASGNGSGLTNRALNAKGGAQTVTLSTAQLPPHDHGIKTRQDDYNVSGGKGPSYGKDNGAYKVRFNTTSTGSGKAHENMPPFYVLAFIMKL